jgi:RNA polymerase sigma factor (sigma-70 family)
VTTGLATIDRVQDKDRRISETIRREKARLRNFIRKRVPDRLDVEDVLQDVFFELVEASRLAKPIDQVGAWLFRVARNRIADLLRKKEPERLGGPAAGTDAEGDRWEDLLPSPDAGPDAVYARTVLLEELGEALAELPAEQRAVFLAHEVEGRSFRELAAETGLPVNTLLSRKRYAVLHLRSRLRSIYADFTKG